MTDTKDIREALWKVQKISADNPQSMAFALEWHHAALVSILEYLDAHAGGATVSERERVPSAVEVTVEEGEALEWAISRVHDGGGHVRSRKVRAAREALRKLKARAISNSETTQPAQCGEEDWNGNRCMHAKGHACDHCFLDGSQLPAESETPAAPQPATGDGTGERLRPRQRSEDGQQGFQDGMLQACRLLGYGDANTSLEALVEFIRSETKKWDAAETKAQEWSDRAMSSAREAGEANGRAEKAEREATELRAALCKLADVETDTGETTLELVHLVDLDVNCEHERAEKAEARVKAWTPVVLWACIEQATPAERALQIEHFAAQIPAEHRPGVKP